MQSALPILELDAPLRKNLTAIFLTGLFFWSSMASQLPTLPLYINTLTKSFDEVGVIMGAFAIGLLACRSYLGRLTDRKGRTYTMRIGLVVAIAIPLCYAAFPYIPLLIFFRAVHGISIAAFASSYSALIADLAPVENRGKVIGYMSLVNPLGMAIGPALGGAMYQVWGYQAFFVVASLLALSGLLLTTQIKVVEVLTKTGELANRVPAKFWQTFLNPRIRVICIVLLIVGIAFGTISAFMPILMQQKQIVMNAGVFYMSAALSGFIVRLPLARLSDAWGRGIFISVGIMCYGLSLLIIYLSSQDYHFVLSGIMEGIGAGIVIPTVVALLADRTVPHERGYVFGLTWIGFDLGIAMAGPIMGKLTGLVGVNNIFAITTGLCLVGLCIFATQSNKTFTNSLRFAIGKSKDDYALG